MSQILANNLLTQQFDMKSSQYKMVQVNPQSTSYSPITSAGGQQCVFEISPSVYNWSKTRFDFTCTPAAGGASKFNFIMTDGFCFIRTMKLTTRSGVEIFSCDDIAKLTNMLMRRKLPAHIAKSLESSSAFNEGASISKDYALTFYRPEGTGRTTGGELRYLYPLAGTANTADPVCNFSYLFGLLFETLFEEDKSLFLGNDIVYLTITFHSSSMIAFTGETSATDPTTVGNYTGNLTLTNVKLWMAQDTNLETINMLKSKVGSAEGMRILYKHPIYNKLSGSGTSQNISVKFNSALGKRLKAIYHAPYNNTEGSALQLDHNNLSHAKVEQYYITINNVRTTDVNIDVDDYTDYKFYKSLHNGACVLDLNDYYFNWVMETNLGVPLSVNERKMNNPTFDNVIEGMPLDQEVKYDFVGVACTGDLQHYIFGIVERELLINSSGISIIN